MTSTSSSLRSLLKLYELGTSIHFLLFTQQYLDQSLSLRGNI